MAKAKELSLILGGLRVSVAKQREAQTQPSALSPQS